MINEKLDDLNAARLGKLTLDYLEVPVQDYKLANVGRAIERLCRYIRREAERDAREEANRRQAINR